MQQFKIAAAIVVACLLPGSGLAQIYSNVNDDKDDGLLLSSPRISFIAGYVNSQKETSNRALQYSTGYQLGGKVSINLTELLNVGGEFTYDVVQLDENHFKTVLSNTYSDLEKTDLSLSGGENHVYKANLQVTFKFIPKFIFLDPYLTVGIGWVYHRPQSYTYTILSDSASDQLPNENSSYLLIGGGGYIPLTDHIELGARVQFEQDISLTYGVTLSYRFGKKR